MGRIMGNPGAAQHERITATLIGLDIPTDRVVETD